MDTLILSAQDIPKTTITNANEQYTGSDTPFSPEMAQQIQHNFEKLPVELQDEINRQREEISDIVNCRSPKIGIIVGPCSIHDIDEANSYLDEIESLQNEINLSGLGDQVKLIVRLYGEKPRSQNRDNKGELNWRGFIAHPDLHNKQEQILDDNAVRQFESLMLGAYQRKLAIATEFLNMETVKELAHLPSLIVVGARTVEQKKFIDMAAVLTNTPFGFKNSTNGSIEPAIQAVNEIAGQNPNGFVILRGGDTGPNWDSEHRGQAQIQMPGKQVCIDTCHGNSGKNLDNTRTILAKVLNDIRNDNLSPGLLMLESNLEEGSQRVQKDAKPEQGVSVTDPCIGIEETKDWVIGLANTNLEKQQNERLSKLRIEIDRIDQMLIELLANRFSVVNEVGETKARLGRNPLDTNRWNTLMDNLVQNSRQLGLDESLVRSIWNTIHEHALALENVNRQQY